MQRLKAVFKNTQGLHARIDTYLEQRSVLKIGLVPLTSRQRLSGLLNALIDDPIQATAWGEAVANRPLSKDTLVVQSPSFEFVETHNSLIVYPVPFSGPAVEYLEVNSRTDSWDHLKTCHLHLLMTDSNNVTIPEVDYPSLTVVDLDTTTIIDTTNNSSNSNNNKNLADQESHRQSYYTGDVVNVGSHLALHANKLLQSSPSMASKYLEYRRKSGIESLKALFDRGKIYKALKDSIIVSCEKQINELREQANTELAASSAASRKQWSQRAHEELQADLLPQIKHILFHDLAFYKLYARTDDIESILSQTLGLGLPQSQAQLQYLMGHLTAGKDAPMAPSYNSIEPLVKQLEPATLSLQNTALKSVLSSLLGIQLPLVLLSAAGMAFGGLGWFSMGALASLGIVSGLKKLQNDWVVATSKYEDLARNECMKFIENAEKKLWEAGEKTSYSNQQKSTEMEAALIAVKESQS